MFLIIAFGIIVASVKLQLRLHGFKWLFANVLTFCVLISDFVYDFEFIEDFLLAIAIDLNDNKIFWR